MAGNEYVVVVAIDFGTTYSGYAFSLKDKPDDIKMNKNWGETLGFQSYKTSTTVLVNPEGEMDSFGFEAEKKFAELDDGDLTAEQYRLYTRFKMKLYGKKLQRTVSSLNGGIYPTMDVVAMLLSYLKDHFLKALSKQMVSTLDVNLIRWVLTVPAIWGDAGKQFMRKAAVQAKLIDEANSKQLIIALEPEAASLYCRSLHINDFLELGREDRNLNLAANTKYMIIDAGGGTIDITVHEITETGTVREVHKATGGPWGGTLVDAGFKDMLHTLFGQDFMTSFKQSNPTQWLEMMMQFEKRKRPAEPNSSGHISIPLSYAFVDKYRQFCDRDIRSAFEESQVSGVKLTQSGELRITSAKTKELFHDVLDKIRDHIQMLLQNPVVRDVKYIYLVGGFGESKYLQSMIQEHFGQDKTILIPEEAGMCVLKGAVKYGHSPDEITSRISKFTYAVGKSRDFVEGVDNETLKTHNPKTGKQRISFLRTLVTVGDAIAPGRIESTTIHPHTADTTELNCVLYYSDDVLSDKAHPSDGNVHKLCKLKIHSPDTSKGRDRKFRVFLTFGGTELYFIVLEDGTDNEVTATIDMDL